MRVPMLTNLGQLPLYTLFKGQNQAYVLLAS
jgi:hypothetical protein